MFIGTIFIIFFCCSRISGANDSSSLSVHVVLPSQGHEKRECVAVTNLLEVPVPLRAHYQHLESGKVKKVQNVEDMNPKACEFKKIMIAPGSTLLLPLIGHFIKETMHREFVYDCTMTGGGFYNAWREQRRIDGYLRCITAHTSGEVVTINSDKIDRGGTFTFRPQDLTSTMTGK